MKVGRGRHPRVWFAAAPPGGPRKNPVGYYRAGLGPGTVERESGKSRWRAGQARSFFLRLLWRATPPHFGGREKETGKPQARPNLGPLKLGCFTIESVFLRSPPRKRGPRSQMPSERLGPRLR